MATYCNCRTAPGFEVPISQNHFCNKRIHYKHSYSISYAICLCAGRSAIAVKPLAISSYVVVLVVSVIVLDGDYG